MLSRGSCGSGVPDCGPSCPGCDPGIRRSRNEFGSKQKKTDIATQFVAWLMLPPQLARGHSDFSILIVKSILAIAGEKQGTIEIDPVGVASEEASGSDGE